MIKNLDDAMDRILLHHQLFGEYPHRLCMYPEEYFNLIGDMKERGYWGKDNPGWPSVITPGGECVFYALE
jgi:hypothetical protein